MTRAMLSPEESSSSLLLYLMSSRLSKRQYDGPMLLSVRPEGDDRQAGGWSCTRMCGPSAGMQVTVSGAGTVLLQRSSVTSSSVLFPTANCATEAGTKAEQDKQQRDTVELQAFPELCQGALQQERERVVGRRITVQLQNNIKSQGKTCEPALLRVALF